MYLNKYEKFGKPKQTKWNVCSYHIMYAFQSESTLYSCLNVKKLLAWIRCKIWSLSDCNWTRTQNHLVCKWTLDHLAKWLSVCLWTKWFWVWVQFQWNLLKWKYPLSWSLAWSSFGSCFIWKWLPHIIKVEFLAVNWVSLRWECCKPFLQAIFFSQIFLFRCCFPNIW